MTETLTHTDVVCPPDPTAECGNCGKQLREHAHDGDHVLCYADRTNGWEFDLAAGESLDCPNAAYCDECEVLICSEHSVSFTTCVANSAVLHHWECRASCPNCADAARDDARNGGL